MPRASHRLDLLLIPTEPERALVPSAWNGLAASWEARGLIRKERAGPDSESLIRGGFRRIWLDNPGVVQLYANHQGGYRVFCPGCERLITAAFVPALQRWRRGGARQIDCPECQESFSLESLDFRPEAGFARWALAFGNVQSLTLEPGSLLEAEKVLGPLRSVLRRVG